MSMKPRIQFTCPKCSRRHDRGYLNGVDVFRCLHCGYVGFGYDADARRDALMHEATLQNEAWERSRRAEAVG